MISDRMGRIRKAGLGMVGVLLASCLRCRSGGQDGTEIARPGWPGLRRVDGPGASLTRPSDAGDGAIKEVRVYAAANDMADGGAEHAEWEGRELLLLAQGVAVRWQGRMLKLEASGDMPGVQVTRLAHGGSLVVVQLDARVEPLRPPGASLETRVVRTCELEGIVHSIWADIHNAVRQDKRPGVPSSRPLGEVFDAGKPWAGIAAFVFLETMDLEADASPPRCQYRLRVVRPPH